MKIAMTISGQPRQYAAGFLECKKWFLDKYDIDVYLHSWVDNEFYKYDFFDEGKLQTTYTVNYADPSNSNGTSSLPAIIYIDQPQVSQVAGTITQEQSFLQYPTDIEYFQLLTGLTVVTRAALLIPIFSATSAFTSLAKSAAFFKSYFKIAPDPIPVIPTPNKASFSVVFCQAEFWSV